MNTNKTLRDLAVLGALSLFDSEVAKDILENQTDILSEECLLCKCLDIEYLDEIVIIKLINLDYEINSNCEHSKDCHLMELLLEDNDVIILKIFEKHGSKIIKQEHYDFVIKYSSDRDLPYSYQYFKESFENNNNNYNMTNNI